MKSIASITLFVAILAGVILFVGASPKDPAIGTHSIEYAWVRWDGKDNTHVITPSGEVEFLGPKLKSMKRPDRADERAFYLAAIINSLAKDDWEVVACKDDDVLLKRIKK